MFTTVFRNLVTATRTRAPADTPAIPETFRGAIVHDASLCTACGTCAFVCAPKAITFAEEPGVSVTWRFYIGSCSFCGLCEQNCPTQAISFQKSMPLATNSDTSDGLRLESIIRLQACTRCGAAHIPLPEAVMAKLMSGELTGVAEAEKGYCPECRRWAASVRLRSGFVPGDDGEECQS